MRERRHRDDVNLSFCYNHYSKRLMIKPNVSETISWGIFCFFLVKTGFHPNVFTPVICSSTDCSLLLSISHSARGVESATDPVTMDGIWRNWKGRKRYNSFTLPYIVAGSVREPLHKLGLTNNQGLAWSRTICAKLTKEANNIWPPSFLPKTREYELECTTHLPMLKWWNSVWANVIYG